MRLPGTRQAGFQFFRKLQALAFFVLGFLFIFNSLLYSEPRDKPPLGTPDSWILNCTIHVDAASKSKKPDGSQANPFPSTGAAVEYITLKGWSQATILLAAGHYREKTIRIPCHLRLLAFEKSGGLKPGAARRPVINTVTMSAEKPVTIEIQNISFENARLLFSGTTRVVIKNCDFSNAPGNAVSVAGGAFFASNLSVTGTRALSDTPGSGVAVLVNAKTTAVFKDCDLGKNADGALRIRGEETRVYGVKLLIRENDCSRASAGGYTENNAALEVTGGARLFLENSTISGNTMIGVLVYEGGKAHIQNTIVSGTRQKRLVLADGRETLAGGTNIAVFQRTRNLPFGNTTLELDGVTSEGAGFAGLQIVDAWVYLKGTRITRNVAGLVMANPNGINLPALSRCFLDSFCFNNDVNYSVNDVEVSSPNVSISDSGMTLDPGGTESSCGRVPFERLELE